MLWTAFLLGFLGSFHCVGMCGPIALALSSKDRNRHVYNKLAYNLGRTFTYSVLGALVGLIGFTFAMAGLQQWLSVLFGGVIVIMAFFYKKSERWIGRSGLFGGVNKVKFSLSRYLKKKGIFAFLVTGVLNGLLPCGMVYIALLASLAMQSPLYGATYMFVFGLGTIPVLLVLMVSQKMLPLSFRTKLTNGLPYLAMFIGLLFIVRGMGLGLHYVSPKLGVPEAKADTTEMTLCE